MKPIDYRSPDFRLKFQMLTRHPKFWLRFPTLTCLPDKLPKLTNQIQVDEVLFFFPDLHKNLNFLLKVVLRVLAVET